MMVDDHDRFQYLGNTPTSDVPIYSMILFSFILNSLFCYFLPSSVTILKKSYIVSTFHALVCVCSVANYFAHYTPNLRQINRVGGGGVYGTGDEVMAYSVCYSIGYFLYDLLFMLLYKSIRTRAALAHHIIITIGFYSGVMNGICHPCHFYLLAEELSTIPLNFKAIYHDRPRLHDMFGYIFIFSFFLSRIIYGSIICAYAFRAAPEFIRMAYSVGDWESIIIGTIQASLCSLTRILNIYWAILILRKIFSSKKSKDKSS